MAIDQAIVVVGYFKSMSLLLQTEAGQTVSADINEGPLPVGCPGTWAELIPKQPLEPNATYKVHAAAYDATVEAGTITFSTGARRLDTPTLAKPTGKMSSVRGVPDSLCGTGSVKSCVSIDDYVDVEVVARKDGKVTMRAMMSSSQAEFGFENAPDCLEFRRRAQNGARSEPLLFCGDALEIRAFRESDMRGGAFLCRDGVIGGQDRPTLPLDTDDSPLDADEPLDDDAPRDDDGDADAASPAAGGCSTGGSSPGGGELALWLFGLALGLYRVWRAPARRRSA